MVNEESSFLFKDILATIQKVEKISADNDELRSADLTKLREELIAANKNWLEHRYSANESKAFWDRQKALEESFENLLNHQQRQYENRRASKSNIFNKNVKSRVLDRIQYEPQEISKFNNFLKETGGHCGGWKEGDHLLYQKIVAKHKLEEAADIINDHLPDISKEEVLEHDQWYKKYVDLKSKYKRAISEWRSKQSQQNQKNGNSSLKNIGNSTENKTKTKTVRKLSESEKERMKEWKVQQFYKKEKELEESRIQEMLKKEKEEQKRKKLVEQRAIVNHYRKEKAECEKALAAAREAQKFQEMREAAARANEMIKQFRIEDRKFIERMKEKRQLAQKHFVLPPAKSTVEAERDPNRVLQPTHVWLCRTRARRQSEQLEKQQEEPFPSPPVTVFNVPKLKVPSWRQGLHS